METYPFLIFSLSIAVLAVVFPAILHYSYFREEKTLRSISATWRNGFSFIFVSNALAVVLSFYPYCLCDLAWQLIISLFSLMALLIFLFNPADSNTEETKLFSVMHTTFAFVTFFSMYGISIFVQVQYFTFGNTKTPNYAAGLVFWILLTISILGLCLTVFFDSSYRKWRLRKLKLKLQQAGKSWQNNERVLKIQNEPWPYWVAIFEVSYVLFWCMQLLCVPNGVMVDHY